MKIYTKQGDSGQTQLPEYGWVDKDNQTLKTIGALDELNSLCGMLQTYISKDDILSELTKIQNQLFELGAHLASTTKIDFAAASLDLERKIDRMSSQLSVLDEFILPGGTPAAAVAHVCRSVCRRAEIHLVSLNKEQKLMAETLSFMNRLSDYFFTLARLLNHTAGQAEKPWSTK